MQEIKKALVMPRLKYYETHLSLLNCILPIKMTPMEIKVIASFMSLTGAVAEYRFGPTAKKIVMNAVNPDKPLSAAGLSNYIVSLKEKNFLVEKEGTISFYPLLIPEENEQQYRFKLINNDSNIKP